MTPIEIVTDFCAAFDRLDWDRIHALLADDIVYHNIPMEPVYGLEAFKTTYAAFPVSEARFEIHHIAASGAVVFTERTDRFLLVGKPIIIRVMGVFEIRDDKIAVWRDYFDLAQFAGQMSAPQA